ncbi:MAG: hypothetical protein J6X81_01510, partial [Muribaculaceae bacterium]|nr:hypothetical protein [Muribaculaceae bacterium]
MDEAALAEWRERNPEAAAVQPNTQQENGGTAANTQQGGAQLPKGYVEGAPEAFAPDMGLVVRDDDGTEKKAVVQRMVRMEGGDFVTDPEGNIVEIYGDNEKDFRHIHKNQLAERVVGWKTLLQDGEQDGEDAGGGNEITSRPTQTTPTAQTEETENDNVETVDTELPDDTEQVVTPMPTVKVGNGKNAHDEPDFVGAGAERSFHFITEESGLPKEVQAQLVNNGVADAQAKVERANKAKDKVTLEGTNYGKYMADMAAAEAEIAAAKNELAVWNEIKARYDALRNAERAAAEAEQAVKNQALYEEAMERERREKEEREREKAAQARALERRKGEGSEQSGSVEAGDSGSTGAAGAGG